MTMNENIVMTWFIPLRGEDKKILKLIKAKLLAIMLRSRNGVYFPIKQL